MGVAIRDILSECRTPVEWAALSGVAAIDAHNALYQFLSIIRQPDGTPLMDHEGRITSHLSGLFFRTVNFIEKGIRPVYIFDGKPPEFKARTVELRREVRKKADERWQEAMKVGDIEEAYKQARSASRIDAHVIASSKELLTLMGIPVLDAPSEGEAQVARMVVKGDADYAVSQDYDALLFGAPLLVRNLTVSGKRKMRGKMVTVKPEKIVLQDVLSELILSREELVEIGILIGTDFNEGIRGVGAKTALKIVRQGKFDEVVREKMPGFDIEPVKSFFMDPPVTNEYMVQSRKPDREGIVDMLCGQYDFSDERVESALEKMSEQSGQKTLDQWF
jgi:flap endonuclease-1